MPDLRPLADGVGAVVPETVIVYGSLPDRAGDLDLVVRPAAREALERWLPAVGFRRVPAGWLRVEGGVTGVVDLADVAEWMLDEAAVAELFDAAIPLAGHLCRPAPRHALLLLARRLQADGGRLEHRRQARGRRVLDEEPDALTEARALAQAWHCSEALEVLAADLEGRRLSSTERRTMLRADGLDLPARWRATVGTVFRRPPTPGVVIAVSGLDGAGKSTLVTGMLDGLASVGLAPVVLWHWISYGRVLVLIAAPGKALVGLRARLRRTTVRPGRAGPHVQLAPDPAAPPQHSPVWPLVVALVHVLTAGTVTRWHLRHGRIVVRDRYVLDSLVHQLHRYGDAAPVGLHRSLLWRGMPRPRMAILLDVPAEVAWRRKPEQFTVDQLSLQRDLYLRHHAELGVRRVDGTRPAAELRDQLVREALLMLAPTRPQDP